MSKRNYNKVYDEVKKEKTTTYDECPKPVVDNEVVEEEVVEEEKINIDDVPDFNEFGVVACKKLNMRKSPTIDADVVCVLDEGEVVKIESYDSDEFYKATSGKQKGYCMKKFIKQL